MNYTILETTTETIKTKVEYDLDGTKVVVDVIHFRPESDEVIAASIIARGETELLRLEE